MDPGLWRVIGRVREGVPGAEEEFVEWTRPDLFIEPEQQARFYEHVGQHLAALRKGDDFDAWFARQQTLATSGDAGSQSTSQLSLTEAVRAGAQQKVFAASTRQLIVRSVLSAWLPMLLTCLTLAICTWKSKSREWSSESELLLLALLGFSLLAPTILSFLLSPVLKTWRAWIRRDQLGVLGASLLFTVVVLPLLASLTIVWTHLPRIWMAFPGQVSIYGLAYLFVLPAWAIGNVGSNLSDLIIPTVAAGMMTWLLCVTAHLHSWVAFSKSRPVRKGLSTLFLGTFLLGGLLGGASLLYQSRPSPDLVSYIKNHPAADGKEDPSLTHKLEKDTRFQGYVPSWSWNSDEGTDNRGICRAWLEAGEDLWPRENWWKDPRFSSLVDSAGNSDWLHAKKLHAIYPEIEARVRVSFSKRYGRQFNDAADRMVDAKLSTREWDQVLELAQLALKTHRAEQTESLEDDIAGHFRYLLRESPASLSERTDAVELNFAWQEYQRTRERLLLVEPLSAKEVEKLRGYSTAALRLRLLYDDIAYLKARTIMVAEVKRLQSSGRRVPNQIDEFRSEITEQLSPYKERLQLRQEAGELIVELLQPGDLKAAHAIKL